MRLEIRVLGSPAPQGSKRFVGRAKDGRGVLVESSKAVKPWREAVKQAAIDQMCDLQITGPVIVGMTFTVPKPKSAPKSRRTYPDRKPDLSKLVRSTEDALTDAGIWEDDARVVECLARKVFPGEHPDSLRTPGAVIRIMNAANSYPENKATDDLCKVSKSVIERAAAGCQRGFSAKAFEWNSTCPIGS